MVMMLTTRTIETSVGRRNTTMKQSAQPKMTSNVVYQSVWCAHKYLIITDKVAMRQHRSRALPCFRNEPYLR